MSSQGKGSVVSLRKDTEKVSKSQIPALQNVISREFFEAVFEQAIAMYVARPDGAVLYANSDYCDIFKPKTTIRADKNIIPSLPDDHKEIVEKVAKTRIVETRKISVETGLETQHFLARHFPIYDSTQNLIAIGGSFIDATKEVITEKRLQKEKRRFLDITRAASDWIWETNEDGKITFVSDRVAQAVGMPPILLKNRTLSSLGKFQSPLEGEISAETAIEKQIPFRTAAFEIADPSGDKRIYNLSGVPVFDEKGRFRGYRGTSDDITARLVAEGEAVASKADLELAINEITNKNIQLEMTTKKAIEAAHAKDEFLANMSHELRTPLNAIIGFSELIELETFGALGMKYKEYIGDILHSGQHLLSLIEDILDIARIESDQIPVEPVDTKLDEIIRDSVVLVQKYAEEKYLDLTATKMNSNHILHVDQTRCLQILVNILGNAVKFTPAGGKIGIETTEVVPDFLDITVWDTGIGIAEKEITSIFEAFKQAHDGVYQRGHNGVGLGLTLSRRLARLMDGDIFVSSTFGKGSRFTIRLPLAV
jgi:PAS domain S-box-containing protein